MTSETISRRHALAGAATVGLGVPLLAACGDGANPTTATDASPSPITSNSPSTPPRPTGPSSSPAGGGGGLANTADIPVGSGAIFADERVVVTQPTEGDFKGFSATCTHQGCTVATVSEGGIVCPCHNSVFSVTDGSPTGGPASAPLGEVTLTIDGDTISLA